MKILVVDDSDFQLDATKQMLAGHELITASTFEEVRAILNETAYFEVVLTDLMMPGEKKVPIS